MPRSSVCCSVPVSADQSRTVLSSDPDATSLESGENATEVTQFLWPSSVCKQLSQFVATFGLSDIQEGMSS